MTACARCSGSSEGVRAGAADTETAGALSVFHTRHVRPRTRVNVNKAVALVNRCRTLCCCVYYGN